LYAKSFILLNERLSEMSFVGSIVPNNRPKIGIISDIEKRENKAEIRFSNEFKTTKKIYGLEKLKILRVDFIY
tara:strand:- start:223 stop:441 length:219 start_codon:yes stop_codon:yes gene_type:complete